MSVASAFTIKHCKGARQQYKPAPNDLVALSSITKMVTTVFNLRASLPLRQLLCTLLDTSSPWFFHESLYNYQLYDQFRENYGGAIVFCFAVLWHTFENQLVMLTRKTILSFLFLLFWHLAHFSSSFENVGLGQRVLGPLCFDFGVELDSDAWSHYHCSLSLAMLLNRLAT